jgi:hypothetical protein
MMLAYFSSEVSGKFEQLVSGFSFDLGLGLFADCVTTRQSMSTVLKIC